MNKEQFFWSVISSFLGSIVFYLIFDYFWKKAKISNLKPVGPIFIIFIPGLLTFILSKLIFKADLIYCINIALISVLTISFYMLASFSVKLGKLTKLKNILGIAEWNESTKPIYSVKSYLNSVSRNFCFMGMGFSKFVNFSDPATGENLESVIARCDSVAPRETIKIMVMNPFCNQIDEYEVKTSGYNIPSTPEKIMQSLLSIENFRNKGYNIETRFYPNSMKALANFRLFFVDEKVLFASFYKYQNEGYNVPQIKIVEHEDNNFYRPFSELFRCFWESGEDADFYKIHMPVSTDDIINGNKINKLKDFVRISLKNHFPTTELRKLNICTAALAGRDSVAAILKTIRSREFSAIVPIIISIPTEYGDHCLRLETVKKLRKYSEEHFDQYNSIVTHPIIVNDAGLWGKINSGSNLLEIQKKYNAYTPCIGCHLYVHAIRCHLSKDLGIKHVISGDRKYHENIIKLNQLSNVLEIFQSFVQETYGTILFFPLVDIKSPKDIDDLLKSDSSYFTEIKDLNCHFGKSGSVIESEINETFHWDKYLLKEAIPKYKAMMRY